MQKGLRDSQKKHGKQCNKEELNYDGNNFSDINIWFKFFNSITLIQLYQ